VGTNNMKLFYLAAAFPKLKHRPHPHERRC